MEILFIVILPREYVHPIESRESTAEVEFTVKELQPFTSWRETKEGRKRVLDVVDMVTTALSGLVPNFVCLPGGGDMYQIAFPSGGSKSMTIFSKLQQLGVGETFGSISAVPLSVSASSDVTPDADAGSGPSLKLRQLVAELRSQSQLTFDATVLCAVASIIAAVGLATNNVVMVVASMLVSPLMGPILGLSFGTVIYDWKLMSKAALSETLMLGMCLITGFLSGIPFAFYDQEPTFEMTSRGEKIALLYGLCVAVPSGIGVAMSILQSNTTSLVGVAISASLLPPAVNSGLLFANMSFGSFDNSDARVQVLYLALFSFALTALNIVCIYIASIVWFKVKEIAPFEAKSDVWKCYIDEVVRHRTLKGSDAKKMKQLLQKELGGKHPAFAKKSMKSGRDELASGFDSERRTRLSRQALSTAKIEQIFRPPDDNEDMENNPDQANVDIHSDTNSSSDSKDCLEDDWHPEVPLDISTASVALENLSPPKT